MSTDILDALSDNNEDQVTAKGKLDKMMPPEGKKMATDNKAKQIETSKKQKSDEKGFAVKDVVEPFTKEQLVEKTLGFSKEVTSNGESDEIIKNAKENLKPSELDKNGDPKHRSTGTETVDRVDYKYIRDNFHNPKDRLFISNTAKEDAKANKEAVYHNLLKKAFEGEYEEIQKPTGVAKQALNYAAEQIGQNDTFDVKDKKGNLLYVYTKDGKLYKAK